MGVSVNSGNVGVTGTVQTNLVTASNIAIPNANQTVLTFNGTGNNANQTVYTVTAGKTFYVFGMTCDTQGANSYLALYKNDGTTRMFYLVQGTNTNSSILCSSVPIAVYTATQNVIAKATNAATYSIWGIEV